MNIKNHLSDLSDDELIKAFNVAKDDLAEAAAQRPNSYWHQACFAGTLVYAGELQKRGITVNKPH